MSFKQKYNSFIDRLIYKGDKENPDTYRKGRFFIISMGLLLAISIISLPFYLGTMANYSMPLKVANFLAMIFQLSIFIVYPRFGFRVLLANLYFTVGAVISFITMYTTSGGIYSPDNAFGIVIAIFIFLVANRISGYIWSFLGIGMTVALYYADAKGYHTFRADEMKLDNSYFMLSWLFSTIFATILIIIHENSKDSYINEVKKSRAELEKKSKELESQKEDIVSSINYAKRIQYAVLPNEETIYRSIPLSFIIYKPRDIVSGDFFWFHELDRDNYILACGDCTGHGVPGAFMTVIGSNALTQIVTENKVTDPTAILSQLDERVTSTLKQEKSHHGLIQDGMDISIVKVNKAKKELIYSSAKRPAVFIRENDLKEIKGSRCSIGGLRSEKKAFENIVINFQEDDMLYLFTDGIVDQFGGPNNKKYTSKRLRQLLTDIHTLPVVDQKKKTESAVADWKGMNEQTDDVLLMGIRF